MKPEPFVRLMAQCDMSPTGKVAFAYVAMLDMAHTPLRIVSIAGALQLQPEADIDEARETGPSPNPWVRWEKYLLTAVPKEYVNVVCYSPPTDTRKHTAWSQVRTVTASANALLVHSMPTPIAVVESKDYESIMCTSKVVADAWTAAVGGRVVPGGRTSVTWILSSAFHSELARIGGMALSRGPSA